MEKMCQFLRWRKKNTIFFSNLFLFKLWANIINNFLPSILFGDLSKLFSPNKSKEYKKTELKFIFVDRIIGFITLFNLGFISLTYLNIINVHLFLLIICFQLFFFIFFKKFNYNLLNIQSVLFFIKKLPTFSVFLYSFISQFFFSLSLYIQIFAFKDSIYQIKDFFTSIFLNFMGIVPFSINGWGVREWAASKISIDMVEHNNLLLSSIIFGICFSISNLLIFCYTLLNYEKVTKN